MFCAYLALTAFCKRKISAEHSAYAKTKRFSRKRSALTKRFPLTVKNKRKAKKDPNKRFTLKMGAKRLKRNPPNIYYIYTILRYRI